MFGSKNKPLLVGAAFLSIAALSGCTVAGTATTVVAVAGKAAVEARSFETIYDDAAIQTELNGLLFAHDANLFSDVDLTVREGKVLLTGLVDDDDGRRDAVKLAWQVEGVKEVINELELETEDRGLLDIARDSWVSTKLEAQLLFDKEVDAVNYTIDVVNGSVYVMGLARTQTELDRVIGHARSLGYVKRVVSLVRIEPKKPAKPASDAVATTPDALR